jgi:alpha-1,2-mannosyltransferase
MRSRLQPHAWTLLIALLAVVLLNGALISGLVAYGVPAEQALHQTAPGRANALLSSAGNDSWKPMSRAQRAFEEQPDASLYRVFFEDHIKFQYPPSALFVLDLFPSRWFDGPESLEPGLPMNQLLTWASRVAFAVGLLICVLLYTHGESTLTPRDRLIILVCGVLLGGMFYPIVRAHILGQIQIFIDSLVAAALLAYLTGRRALAGACIGLCCLIKPQYGLILLWGVLRRDGRFSVGLIAVAGVGLTAAMIRYGFANHLEYLKVLRFIAQHGEAYWPNQSVNGLLNRLLDNGDPLHFDRYSFPPYHPIVYFGTLLSSLAIMTIALWRTRGRAADSLDLAIALLGATLAAPVAWEHHYGILLAIFAVATPMVLKKSSSRLAGALLLASYLMVANALLRPSWLLSHPVTELLASHLFFGALLLFAILITTRAKSQPAPAPH